jgi:hypothetical protein
MKTTAQRKPSLREMTERIKATEVPPLTSPDIEPQRDTQTTWRTAQTRNGTRQISGHFPPEASRTLRLIAIEQDRDVQEMLAEALNMLFARYGKPVRLEVSSGRRRKEAAK